MAKNQAERPGAVKPDTSVPSGAPIMIGEPVPEGAELSWGWQLALFLWVVSFFFLFLNDLVACLFKIGSRIAGG